MAKKTTRMSQIVGMLGVDKKKLAKHLKISIPRLDQLLNNRAVKQNEKQLEAARQFVKAVADKASKEVKDVAKEVKPKKKKAPAKKKVDKLPKINS